MLRAAFLDAPRRSRGAEAAAASAARCVSIAADLARCLSSLVLAEHGGGKLATATLNTIAAARQLGGSVTALVSGHDTAAAAAAAAQVAGVDKVLRAEHAALEHQLAEPTARLLASTARREGASHVLCASSTFGKNILPRAAALLDCQPVSDVVQILDASTFVRPIYAGNALATIAIGAPGIRMLSVRPTAFAADKAPASAAAPIVAVPTEDLVACSTPGGSEWVRAEGRDATRPELGSARVVVAGGRALKSKESFAVLERIADLLGGALGASRAAVDAGLVPNDLQVGQTGKIVAPELYLAVGISGAIQHVAGMKDSRVIVAINNDPSAPIFGIADYGLVADLFEVLPQLEKRLAERRGA